MAWKVDSWNKVKDDAGNYIGKVVEDYIHNKNGDIVGYIDKDGNPITKRESFGSFPNISNSQFEAHHEAAYKELKSPTIPSNSLSSALAGAFIFKLRHYQISVKLDLCGFV